jgi:hypothetical protein
MRVDIFDAGTRVYTEAFDGRRGWQRAAGNAPVQPVSAQGTAALRHGIEAPFKLYGLHELAARGHRVSAVGEESIEGVEYAVIEVRFTDGQEARFYLNPHTGLIERERRLRALHVDVDPTPRLIETLELDYRPVAGVMFPFRQVEREVDSGRVLATTVIASIEVNAELEAADFQPAEI